MSAERRTPALTADWRLATADFPTWQAEAAWAQAGYTRVAGVDEAGRGAWAGPVVAGAVILPDSSALRLALAGVRDSKQCSPAERDELYDVIRREALTVGVGIVPAAVIDEIGIAPATRRAMREAVAQLSPPPDGLLIDALLLPDVAAPQWAIIKGDALCLSIAAASIVAKVTRDRLLIALDAQHPGYGFAQHKGYGTPAHRRALIARGVCPEHRRTYAPIRALWEGHS